MKKLILFDEDGVLIFSMEKSIAFLCQVIESVRLDLDFKIIEDNLGHSFQHVLIPLLSDAGNWPDYKTDLVLEKTKEFFENTHFHGPEDLPVKLQALKDSGYELGIVTNRSERMFLKGLTDISVNPDIFSFVNTADHEFQKPNPKVFDRMLEKYDSDEIIFVGDSPICDLPAAYDGRFKIDFAAIASRIYPKKSFVFAGVPEDMIFESVIDFIDSLLVTEPVA